jgi:pyrimidine-nucleoside phosphorylase
MTWNPVQTIARKRDGRILSADEIIRFIDGFTCGDIPDYQMSALAMAIYLRGMDTEETSALTDRMLHSGSVLSWPAGSPPIVDKHSTGGIGDKVSLVLAPLLACCGLWVPMISGRGLGPTGGTLDKLESIPGFRTDLSLAEIRDVVSRVGCVITGATAEIAPADKRLYALRDVTATVASIPLITASIMSKKLAEGLTALVLDVKWGNGAFMKSLDDARSLAQAMVATGHRLGVATTALVTDMNQPLGRMSGNAVEVDETIAALSGSEPWDLIDVTLALGAELLISTGHARSPDAARSDLQRHLDSGAGLAKFAEMVAAQGGAPDAPRSIAPAAEIVSDRPGWVTRIDTERLGWSVIELGGGRRRMGDPLDHSVGLETLVRLGDRVESGEPLLRVFAAPQHTARLQPALLSAFDIRDEPVAIPNLIVERISP